MELDQDQDTPQQQQVVEQTSPAALLPDVLLAAILQHVPQTERFKHCAVVCKAWAHAAAAATTSLQRRSLNRSTLPALNSWLAEHGKQVELLQVAPCFGQLAATADSVPLQLRCAELCQLTRLDLSSLRLELQLPDSTQPANGASSTRAAPLAILPKLRELRLSECIFTSSAALPQLPGVTQLQVDGTLTAEQTKVEDAGGTAASAPAAPATASNAALAIVRCLPHLVELKLDQTKDAAAADLMAVVPSSLTALTIGSPYVIYGPSHEPTCFPAGFQGLPQLQQLTLSCATFRPAVLASMPQLAWLKIESCKILPWQAHRAAEEGVDGATAFLAAVRGLQHLQHLELEGMLDTDDPQQFVALTAPPQLTQLQLRAGADEELERGIVAHMFPPGSEFKQLQVLGLSNGLFGRPCMRAADLQHIISACPTLCSLDITGSVRGSDVAALLQLPPTCHSLEVGGEEFDDEAAAVICQLTQLTSLTWSNSSGLTDVGLDHLTALHGLQRLQLEGGVGLSADVTYTFAEDPVTMAAWWRVGPPPKQGEKFLESPFVLVPKQQPVWRQLQDLLAKNPANAAWQQQLMQQQEAASRLQQQTEQRLTDSACYMQHALTVMAHCASNSSAVQLVQALADIARTALSGDDTASLAAVVDGAAGGGGGGAGGGVGGGNGNAAGGGQLLADGGRSEGESDEGEEEEQAAADEGQLLEDEGVVEDESDGFSEDESDESDSEDEVGAAADQAREQQQQQQQQQQVMARYLELQLQVLAAFGSSSEVCQALDSMEVVARRAIMRQQL